MKNYGNSYCPKILVLNCKESPISSCNVPGPSTTLMIILWLISSFNIAHLQLIFIIIPMLKISLGAMICRTILLEIGMLGTWGHETNPSYPTVLWRVSKDFSFIYTIVKVAIRLSTTLMRNIATTTIGLIKFRKSYFSHPFCWGGGKRS